MKKNTLENLTAHFYFRPIISLTPEIVADFFKKETATVEMYTNETPDELKPKLK